MIQLASIDIYPCKGLKGISVNQIEIDGFGKFEGESVDDRSELLLFVFFGAEKVEKILKKERK